MTGLLVGAILRSETLAIFICSSLFIAPRPALPRQQAVADGLIAPADVADLVQRRGVGDGRAHRRRHDLVGGAVPLAEGVGAGRSLDVGVVDLVALATRSAMCWRICATVGRAIIASRASPPAAADA